ncbi:MAG: hypothetical protein ACFFG0_28700 [Candidatus Thorarchaeota archaeon]
MLFNKISELYDGEITFYDSLINRLLMLSEDICIINFNYDLLLEQAMQKKSLGSFDKLDSFISGRFKLLKPHGSCNWAYEHVSVPKNNESFDSKIEKLNSLTSNNININGTSAYHSEHDLLPCMVLPINSEDGFFEKKFVFPDSHYEEMKKQLNEVEQILIIGWIGKENHFGKKLKELCSNRNIKLIIVGTKNVDKTKDEIGKYINTQNSITYNKGFENFLAENKLEAELD